MLALRTVSKTEMSKLTGLVSDSRGMTINSIKDDLVKYACMVIGYRTFFASRINSVSSATVNTAYRMIKEDASFDLCTHMQRQLLLNLKSIKQDNALMFKFGKLLVGLFFYFQGYFPRVGDVQWSVDQPVTKKIKKSIQAIGTGYPDVLNKYFDEFRQKMSQRMRISGDIVKKYEDDICFTIQVDKCIMEVVEPRQEEVEPMGYEVMYDMLEGYASTLIVSPLDPKAKRTRTYLERVTLVEEPSAKKGKEPVVKKAKAMSTTSTSVTTTSPKVTKWSSAKKKPEAAPAKVFERKRKTKGNTPDSEETVSEEQPKKARQTRKKTKNEPASSTPVNIDISSYKPLTHCQRKIKNIRRKLLHDLIKYFDDFNDDEKEAIKKEIIQYLCVIDPSPSEIRSETPDSLYKPLDNKWRITIEQEQEMREKVFAEHFPDVSNSKLFDVMNKYKGIFFMRRRRLLLLEGKGKEVLKDTHTHSLEALKMHRVAEANRQVEKELVISKPDEVLDDEGNPVGEPVNTIDVDSLNVEDVTQETPSKATGQDQ